MAEGLAELFRRRPGKWLMGILRAATIMFGLLVAPWVILARAFRRRHESAFEVLRRRAYELWETSPFDGLALVRTTYETLEARGGFDVWKPGGSIAFWASVEVSPFGRFSAGNVIEIYLLLYRFEFALGRYEEAMEVSTSFPAQADETILQQVDCLMATGRRADAIAHLEKNLNLDTWRGALRRRLEELSGKPGGGIN